MAVDPPKDATTTERDDLTENRLSEQSLLVAQAVHKLKNRMLIVAGWAEVLIRAWDRVSDTERTEGLQRILTNSSGAVSDADQLLQQIRAEMSAKTVTVESLRLRPLLIDCLRDWARSSEDRLALDCPEELTVVADPPALRQALSHLLENAIKYSPGSARIDVSAHLIEGRDGPTVEVVVADQGIGVPEHLDVFRAFSRGQGTNIPGTGLGLYIVRHLIEDMGGSVQARRNPGDGSTFTVLLPAPAR